MPLVRDADRIEAARFRRLVTALVQQDGGIGETGWFFGRRVESFASLSYASTRRPLDWGSS
jgi:hypothetical protein